jgi:predicted small lipoprotein YifL
MRTILFSTLWTILILAAVAGCKPEPPLSQPEEDLKTSVDVPSFTTTPAANLSFNLKLESAMPPGGLRIEYNVKGEIDNQIYAQGPGINSMSTVVPMTISNLPRQKICICTIIITSNTKTTNTATQSFRVVYK